MPTDRRIIYSLMLIAAAGCGGDGPAMAPVTGRITIGDEPVARATVLLHSVDDPGARPGAGTTDENGEFRITTLQPGDGGLIGTHRLTVSKAVNPTAEKPGNVFAAGYDDPQETPLTIEVTEDGENRFVLDLPAARPDGIRGSR